MPSVEEKRLDTTEYRKKTQSKGYSCHNPRGRYIQSGNWWNKRWKEEGQEDKTVSYQYSCFSHALILKGKKCVV